MLGCDQKHNLLMPLWTATYSQPNLDSGLPQFNVLLIAFFNWYYTFLQLEPKDLAEQLKRQVPLSFWHCFC